MFLEYIERLREKPYRERRRFAFFVSLGFTAVIAIIWASALPSQIASLTISGDLTGSADATDLGQKVDEAKNGLSSLIEAGKKIQRDATSANPSANSLYPGAASGTTEGAQGSGNTASSSVSGLSAQPIMIEATTSKGTLVHSQNILIATTSSEQTR